MKIILRILAVGRHPHRSVVPVGVSLDGRGALAGEYTVTSGVTDALTAVDDLLQKATRYSIRPRAS